VKYLDFLYTENGKLRNSSGPVLLRGMGLGGWLLPEGYMWKFYTKCDRPRRIESLIEKLCGLEYAESFWKRYYSTYYTEQDIAWMAQQGMNSIRLPINSRHLFRVSGDGEVSFNTEILHYVDECIDWCEKRGMYLFIDMHAAPGGQTGQNIDDSENDIPELFTQEQNQQQLIKMWQMIARRYRDRAAVGGYDLLNEPLPEWNKQYNQMLLPLYRRLISEIRKIDPRHIISLEGAHWATDISVFDDFTSEEAADNILLQFHKYWSDPDEESIMKFIGLSRRLNAPLWMGEGGENNPEWYTCAFPMYERHDIGWNFWTSKKMDNPNSPITYKMPEGWNEILAFLEGGKAPAEERAQEIFDSFISSVASGQYHIDVINALCRRGEINIPAHAYDIEQIKSERERGADFRMTSRATLVFADAHTGKADWNRYDGEAQPESEKILLRLMKGDSVSYIYDSQGQKSLSITIVFDGDGVLLVQECEVKSGEKAHLPVLSEGYIKLECASGSLLIEKLIITEA